MPLSKVKSNIEVIKELEESGALKSLIRAGLFPAKIMLHKEVFFYVDARIKAGAKKTDVVTWTADQFGMSPMQVHRIIKSFKSAFLAIE